MKASTTAGSKWEPMPRVISARASSRASAVRYGRFEVIASKTSATVTTRATSGMSSPPRPSG